MNNTQDVFIKADNGKIINTKCIIWVKKMDECLRICTKSTGCSSSSSSTHKICKINNYDSYMQLNKFFD
jgi:hypothetical protein